MCGIVGRWNRSNARPELETCLAMSRAVRHRGPDDAGDFSDDGLCLAHRRLSVIDTTKGGHQPMTTVDGRFTITFNGEIYNYRELQQTYLGDVTLASQSDTEVLLYLLAQRGSAILPKLRGMFALALWDRDAQELLLVRDPFGKKPLYYREAGSVFSFGSEIKALLAAPDEVPSLDRSALAAYFLHEYVPAPASGWAGIKQVPSGSSLRITKAGVAGPQRYWQPTFTPKIRLTRDRAAAELDRLLELATQRRLIADVPVGLLLSGGLDSTTIGWYMRQATDRSISSFSVSFEEASFDESAYAASAANALGFEHHDIPFTAADVPRLCAELVPLIDSPFADASLLPTYAVSAYARQHITVALDGDGSDELFGGYGTFQAALLARLFPPLAAPLWRTIDAAVRHLPTRYHNFSFDFIAKSFVRGLPHPLPRRNQVWLGAFDRAEIAELLTPQWRAAAKGVYSAVDELAPATHGNDMFDALSLLTSTHYLRDDILVKLDRATMAVALEARTPFLDPDLTDFVMRLPSSLKRRKRLLKQVMRGRIPSAIIDRPKKGFGIPLGLWLRGPLRDWAHTILDGDKLAADGVLNVKVVHRLLREHERGRADHRKKLWTVLAWQLWYDHWVAKRTQLTVDISKPSAHHRSR